jgi:hypothetical protein
MNLKGLLVEVGGWGGGGERNKNYLFLICCYVLSEISMDRLLVD